MIVCRPYIQTRLTNYLIGLGVPVGCAMLFRKVLMDPTYSYKMVYFIFLPLFIGAGLYFFAFHCVWAIKCDEEKKTVTFFKLFRKKTYSIRHVRELIVYKALIPARIRQDYDYCFKIAKHSFTFEEMDNMSELIAFLKKVNPQINIGSPEDHKYF